MSLLTRQEFDALSDALLVAVKDFGNPGDVIVQLVHESLRGKLSLAGVSTAVIVRQAVEICDNDGHQQSPPALLAILVHLEDVGRHGDVPNFATLKQRILTPPPPKPHPLEAGVLFGSIPFADREGLRAILLKMAQGDVFEPILHLGGETKSGKSWSVNLINFYCRQRKDDGERYCEYISPADASVPGPAAIAKDLVTQLGGKPSEIPARHANEDAYMADLAQWVISVANEEEKRCWFVFDGFSGDGLREDTTKFLTHLARHCTKGQASERNYRVVFCDLKHDISTKIPRRVRNYQTEPLMELHIRDFVRSIVRSAPGILDTEIEAIVDETTKDVIGNLQPPFIDLSHIGERLEKVIHGATG